MLFEQVQIHSRYRVALTNYYQQLKCTTTSFTSIDFQSAMYSNKNLTKTCKLLPETLRKSFYKATKDVPFDKCGKLHHSLLHETEPPDKKHPQISKGQALPV